MSIWNVPSKLAYALFVAGDARLGEDARPTLNGVLESLAKGPPPAVELRAWIVDHGRMGTIPIEALRAQLESQGITAVDAGAGEDAQLARATHAMLVASDAEAALDPRAPWGLLVLAATMASASGGVVYDSGTLRFVPRRILENPLDGFMLGSIKNHVAIVTSSDGAGAQRTTTLGLNKYGLFELELAGAADTASDSGVLLAGVAQAVIDTHPRSPGPWEVAPFLDVTRLHVAHALGDDVTAERSGKARLALREKTDDVYWSVVAAGGEHDDAGAIRWALATLGIGD